MSKSSSKTSVVGLFDMCCLLVRENRLARPCTVLLLTVCSLVLQQFALCRRKISVLLRKINKRRRFCVLSFVGRFHS